MTGKTWGAMLFGIALAGLILGGTRLVFRRVVDHMDWQQDETERQHDALVLFVSENVVKPLAQVRSVVDKAVELRAFNPRSSVSKIPAKPDAP